MPMLNSDRNWLFALSHSLDNRRRIAGEPKADKPKERHMFVVFTHEELEKLADDIRTMATADEERLAQGVLDPANKWKKR